MATLHNLPLVIEEDILVVMGVPEYLKQTFFDTKKTDNTTANALLSLVFSSNNEVDQVRDRWLHFDKKLLETVNGLPKLS